MMSLVETLGLATQVEQQIAIAMAHRTMSERREALFALFNEGSPIEKRALYGAVSTLLACLDAIPQPERGRP